MHRQADHLIMHHDLIIASLYLTVTILAVILAFTDCFPVSEVGSTCTRICHPYGPSGNQQTSGVADLQSLNSSELFPLHKFTNVICWQACSILYFDFSLYILSYNEFT